MSVIEAMARAMIRRTAEHYGDAPPENPDTSLTELLVRAALAEARKMGWQLVPVVHNGKAGLTHEMCNAFWERYFDACKKHGYYESTNAGYNAMLSAAPSVEDA